MSTVAKIALEIQQGADFVRRFIWKNAAKKPINLTGYSARLQLRDAVGGTVLAELSTDNGGIALGGAAGTVTVSIPGAETALYSFKSAVYDMLLTGPSGSRRRLVEGKVTVSPAVTV
jgi:hypothetical protein